MLCRFHISFEIELVLFLKFYRFSEYGLLLITIVKILAKTLYFDNERILFSVSKR